VQDEAALSEDQAFLQKLRTRIASRRERQLACGDSSLTISATLTMRGRRLEQDFTEGLSVSSILMRSLPWVRDRTFPMWLKELRGSFEKQAARAD
jgi:hypothetical protein